MKMMSGGWQRKGLQHRLNLRTRVNLRIKNLTQWNMNKYNLK